MALWDKLGSRGSVDDRRGISSGLLFGLPSGIVAISATLVLSYFGVSADPQLVEQLIALSGVGESSSQQTAEFKGDDSYETFVSTVVGSTSEFWKQQFADRDKAYKSPELVLFRSNTRSACGLATSSVGPHYCPRDAKIYIDETFFDTLQDQLGGSNGDVAQAYVIAHEVGHHVQAQLGVLEKLAASSGSGQDSLAVRSELQADCYAGLWADSIRQAGVFENDQEIEEALSAASAVGDDRIQTKTEGRVTPETWTHGSSAQRVKSFTTGYNAQSMDACTL